MNQCFQRLAAATILLAVAGAARADLDKGIQAAEAGDFETALVELRPEAEAGNAKAQFFMGVMYDSGSGVEKDFTRSAYWYALAANQGIATAQYNLGLMFAQGQGVPHDLVIGYTWLDIAASQGDSEAAAQRDIAATQMSETMVARARQAARAWLDAHQNDSPSQD